MKKLIQWYKKQHFVIQVLLFYAVVFLVLSPFFYQKRQHTNEVKRLSLEFMRDEQCRRIGYAGKNAVSVYQCASGIYLYDQIEQVIKNRLDK